MLTRRITRISTRLTASLLTGILFVACPISASASIIDGKVDIATGHHARWVDRLALPDYAIAFYAMLEKGADNDGINDFLIEDRYFRYGDTDYGNPDLPLPAYVQTPDFAGILAARVPEREHDYAMDCCRAACSAFLKDHPEVFWWSNVFVFRSVTIGSRNGDKTSYIFLMLHSDNSDIRAAGYTETIIKAQIAKREQRIAAILENLPARSTNAEKVKYFNEWLTKHNEYNTQVSAGAMATETGYLDALEGKTGAEGPVCSGYSHALKTLCDRVGIPCVVVTSDTHAWNNVEIDGAWYAVDVTNNDPVVHRVDSDGKIIDEVHQAESGYETEEYLLVGSDTLDTNNQRFADTHIVLNPLNDTLFLDNGPILSQTAYLSPATGRLFYDVPADSWYAAGIRYVSEQNMMNGVSAGLFRPQATISRGMIATILYRLDNSPATAPVGLRDVPEGKWYTDAANWAVEQGIIFSLGDQFAPDSTLTRAEFVTILYRYAQYKQYDVSASANLFSYTDAESLDVETKNAFQWSVANYFVNGINDTTLNPTGTLTRAETATVLMRFCNQYVSQPE